MNNKSFTWARFHPKGYEVSSQGDKRFSAFFAYLPDGRSIEEAYQLDIKGYRRYGNNWELGKGRPPLIRMTLEESYQAYLGLWQQWAKENPRLIEELKTACVNRVLTDKFSTTIINQAHALSDILNGVIG